MKGMIHAFMHIGVFTILIFIFDLLGKWDYTSFETLMYIFGAGVFFGIWDIVAELQKLNKKKEG